MCHALRARLSPTEKRTVRKLSGVLIPTYAVLVLLALAITSFIGIPRSNHEPSSIGVVADANRSGPTHDVTR
jgi:hypothetical protein